MPDRLPLPGPRGREEDRRSVLRAVAARRLVDLGGASPADIQRLARVDEPAVAVDECLAAGLLKQRGDLYFLTERGAMGALSDGGPR